MSESSPKANAGGARTTVTPHVLEIKPLQLKDFSAEEGGSEPPSANKDGIVGFFGKGNAYNEMHMGNSSGDGATTIFDSKLYLLMTLVFALAYFVDVFVGMFLLHREYYKTDSKGLIIFDNDKRYS